MSAASGGWRARMRYSHDVEAFDTGEVVGIARVQREIVGNRRRGNHGVECPRRRFWTCAPKRGGDLAECPSSIRIKGQRVEVRLRLLHVGDSRCALRFGGRDQGTH